MIPIEKSVFYSGIPSAVASNIGELVFESSFLKYTQRNPNIADMLKILGFIQRYGIGIQTAQSAMGRNGGPL
jgi:predicted HTH transcriptional regulator